MSEPRASLCTTATDCLALIVSFLDVRAKSVFSRTCSLCNAVTKREAANETLVLPESNHLEYGKRCSTERLLSALRRHPALHAVRRFSARLDGQLTTECVQLMLRMTNVTDFRFHGACLLTQDGSTIPQQQFISQILSSFSHLTSLSLSELSGVSLIDLSTAPHLRSLTIADANVHSGEYEHRDHCKTRIVGVEQLRHISLLPNDIDEDTLDDIIFSPILESLELDEARDLPDDALSCCDLPALRSLRITGIPLLSFSVPQNSPLLRLIDIACLRKPSRSQLPRRHALAPSAQGLVMYSVCERTLQELVTCCPLLEVVRFRDNSLTPSCFRFLCQLPHLRVLYFRLPFSSDVLEHTDCIPLCTNLQSVHVGVGVYDQEMHGGGVNTQTIEAICRLPSLTELSVFSGVQPSHLPIISKLQSLRSLSFGVAPDFESNTEGLSSLSAMTNLTSLQIGISHFSNAVPDMIMAQLTHMTKLRSLGFTEGRLGLTAKRLEYIAGARELRRLCVWYLDNSLFDPSLADVPFKFANDEPFNLLRVMNAFPLLERIDACGQYELLDGLGRECVMRMCAEAEHKVAEKIERARREWEEKKKREEAEKRARERKEARASVDSSRAKKREERLSRAREEEQERERERMDKEKEEVDKDRGQEEAKRS